MKLTFKSATRITTSILTTFLAMPQAWAQATTSTVSQSHTTAAETSQAGINPMTGRPLSEEELHRQLNKSKLMTQLGQEQVKQAQNAAELALTHLRAETEKSRTRAESFVSFSANGSGKSAGVTAIKPMPLPRANANTTQSQPLESVPAASPPSVWGQAVPQPFAKASGTIRIGNETLEVSSNAPLSAPAQVQWVDSQTRQIARAGSPLQPINMQPATGVLGIPAIPGITPAMTPLGQPQ